MIGWRYEYYDQMPFSFCCFRYGKPNVRLNSLFMFVLGAKIIPLSMLAALCRGGRVIRS